MIPHLLRGILFHLKSLALFAACTGIWCSPAEGASAENLHEHEISIVHHLTLTGSGQRWQLTHRYEYEFTRLPGAPQVRYVDGAYEYPGLTVRNFKPFRSGKAVKGDKFRATFYNTSRDLFLSDERSQLVLFDTPFVARESYGFSYDVTYNHPAYLPTFVIPGGNPIVRCQIIIDHPVGVLAELELGEPHQNLRIESDRTNPKVTTLVITAPAEDNNNPAVVGNPFSSYRGLAILTLSAEGKPITPTRPEDFAQWYGIETDLTPDLPPLLAAAMRDSITDGATDKETLSRIHDWVRTNIRYLADTRGRHTIFPARPDSTILMRYGDCKDRAYLVLALARSRGLVAQMGLVYAGWKPRFERTNVALFNHVISVFPLGDTILFADATQRHAGFGQLGSELGENQLLLLDDTSGHYLTIPIQRRNSELSAQFDAHLDSLGRARLTLTCRGDYLLVLRSLQMSQSKIEQAEILKWMLEWELGDFRITEPAITRDTADQITIESKADLSRFFVTGAAGTYITSVLWPRLNSRLSDRSRDSLPLQVSQPLFYDLSISLRGAALSASDSTDIAEQQIARYRSMAQKTSEETVLISYSHEIPEGIYSGEQKAALLNYVNKLADARKRLFTILKVL